MCLIEKELGFFDLHVKRIPLWIYIRERAANMVNGMSIETSQKASRQGLNWGIFFSRAIVFFSKFRALFGNEVIIFANERHLEMIKKTGKYYHPYVEMVIDLEKNNKKFLVLEFPNAMRKIFQKVGYQRYLPMDFILMLKQSFSFLAFFWSFPVKKRLLPALLASRLWDSRSIKEILRIGGYSAYNITFYWFFLRFLKLLNPKLERIYSCMGAYDKFPEVVEIQHGVIHDFHHQYIFPPVKTLGPYLSNKINIVFSERIKNLFIDNGYSGKLITVLPNPKIAFYFKFNGDSEKGLLTSKKKITIIGDWGGNLKNVFEILISSIEHNERLFSGWEINLILHPTQENHYQNKMPKKVRVFENHQISVWESLHDSLCVLAVNSTVLEEATYFGCFSGIILDTTMEDQEYYIDWLCGDYPYKDYFKPEDFAKWFSDHESMLVFHLPKKVRIMDDNLYKFKLP